MLGYSTDHQYKGPFFSWGSPRPETYFKGSSGLRRLGMAAIEQSFGSECTAGVSSYGGVPCFSSLSPMDVGSQGLLTV